MNPFAAYVADLLACLRFFTRLPIPVMAFEPAPHELGDFGRAIRAAPVAGAIIGASGGLGLAMAHLAGLPNGVAAGLALAALALVTGVFHEDGLADTADGLGGGETRERKLDIMKDSRIGSYGAAALALSMVIRWAALGALLDQGLGVACAGLVAAHAVSRAAGLAPLALLPPARAQGAAFAAAGPARTSLALAGATGFALGLAPLLAGVSAQQALAAELCGCAAALAMTWVAHRQIGGQTGDIAGAAQQLAEIAALCVLSAHA